MGRRSSHGALAVRLVENSHTGMTKPWSPLAGLDADREQGYVRRVRPQSDGQQRLMEAIERHHLTIALGPAGTGQTYLPGSAPGKALQAAGGGRVVLTRPAPAAGGGPGGLPPGSRA